MSSYTYSGDPATSPLDAVRFHLQDTADPGLLTDNEIRFLLAEEGDNPYRAAYAGCLTLSRRYAGKSGSRTIGDVSISYGTIAKTYTDLAPSLLSRSGRSSVPTPYLGGLHQGDKDSNLSSQGEHVERVFADDETWENPR